MDAYHEGVGRRLRSAPWIGATLALLVIFPSIVHAQTGEEANSDEANVAASGDDRLQGVVSSERRGLTNSTGLEYVSGDELKRLPSTSIASALSTSTSLVGISTQQRNPVVTDVRVRGSHVGQVLASGSTWIPGRIDLDTPISKIDTRLLADIIVIKGPYTARRGPGFSFIDFDLLPSPRSDSFDWGATTSLEYKFNGDQMYGREHVWAGGANWGARVSYGHRAGSDYEDGRGGTPPTSYNSRDALAHLSYDLTPEKRIEFMYLRSRQSNLEFPTMVYDLNAVVTEGYELEYFNEESDYADEVYAEFWHNRTRFQGDTLRPGKAQQIPSLAGQLAGGSAVTDGRASSTGYRVLTTWGAPAERQLTLGTDLLYQTNGLNDIEAAGNNFPVPDSQTIDVGLIWECRQPLSEQFALKFGGRLDFAAADAESVVPGFPGAPTMEAFFGTGLQQQYFLWSLFASSEWRLTPNVTTTASVGYGQRPPLMTELYGAFPFVSVLQPGLTFVTGDPELDPERLMQIEFGLKHNYERVQSRFEFFYGWYRDYITYDQLNAGGGYVPSTTLQSVAYVNSPKAILWGIEWMGDWNMTSQLDAFCTLSYLRGEDKSRLNPSRMRGVLGIPGTRSGSAANEEPLPGVAPLDVRFGMRFHAPAAPGTQAPWGLEAAVRLVDQQPRVAASLSEFTTEGFATVDVRAHWQATPQLMLIGGVENISDTFYREHLDLRSGIGTFRPGLNGYFGTEFTY